MKTILSEKAMLVTLTVGSWGGRMIDKTVTKEVADSKNASEDAGWYTKQLMSRDALKEIHNIATEARAYHYRLTMPWDDGANRLLPINVYDEYVRNIDRLIERRVAARIEFLKTYNTWIDEAKTRLGKMFDLSDFPSPEKIEARIQMEYKFLPIPDASHFVADLAKDEQTKIKQDIEAQIENRINATVIDLYSRVGSAVQTAAERLEVDEDGKGKIFRDSLIENLRDVATTVQALNITDNETLSGLCADLLKTVDDVQANELRAANKEFDPVKHERVKTDIDNLNEQFAGYFGDGQDAS